jgi:hypothetical protein
MTKASKLNGISRWIIGKLKTKAELRAGNLLSSRLIARGKKEHQTCDTDA